MGLTIKGFLVFFIIGINILAIQSRSINLDSIYSIFGQNSNEEALADEDSPNFQRTETIGEGFRVTWDVDFEAQTVTFDLEVKTKGYVGFGFNKKEGMEDADLIIGGVFENKTTYFEDRYAKGNSKPTLDQNQDWKLIEATETADTTNLKFSRAFDTGDEEEDNVINNEPTKFIWAIGSSDDIEYHATRGNFQVNILEQPAEEETTTEATTQAYDDEINFSRTQKFNENFTVTWEVLFETQQIIFQIEAKTKGYVGFGISNSGTMSPADLVIGGIKDDKFPYFADRYSDGHSTTEDPSQDWLLLEIRQTEDSTFMRVIRNFDTGDSNDIAITKEKTNFIWAIGSDDDIKKHLARGSYAVHILDPSEPQPFVRFEEINANISVSWEVDFEKEVVTFEVLAKTKGYIGFGVSLEGEMAGMDLIMGGVLDDHTPYFADRFATGHRAPEEDLEQNWFLLSARELDEHTYLKFVRKFDTDDSDQDIPINKEDIYFIWALGSTDDITNRHDRPMRGTFPVNVLEAPIVPSSFEREVELSSDFHLTYHVNFIMRRITFEATVASTGYIGFGISPSGTMYNADMVIGGVDDQGISYFDDRVSLKHGVPPVDKYQDWFLESATENNQTTCLSFSRNLFTMDLLEDYPIVDESTYLVWAVGSSDDLSRHAERGSVKINLFQAQEPTTTTTTVAPSPPENFQRTETIADGFEVTWDVNFETEIVTFELQVETTGYIGFGFSEAGNMANADLIFGGVKDDKTPYFEDRFSLSPSTPVLDTIQNWNLIDATETAGITVLKFFRAFDTKDEQQDRPILDKDTHFIWAKGSSDDISYHATRGSFPVNILEAPGSSSSASTASPGTEEPKPTPGASLTTVVNWSLFAVAAIALNIAV